ncbi:MAG: IPT/TIG domain-containing protein [Planctomycetes bacterium]|nr:IPT/TIG domain-containing protein [Planctomycetota bacterium]
MFRGARFWNHFARLTGSANKAAQRGKAARRVSLRLETLEERTVPTLLGAQLFPADNAWNQNVASAPLASNSTAIINNIITKYGDGRLHPDFGQDYHTAADLYGIPYNVVHGNSTAKTTFVIDAYPGESDVIAAPVPAGAVIEGDLQNGPKVGVNNRGDSHLLIFDVDNNIAYEFYRASRPSENADGKWHADQESVWDMKTNTFRTIGDTSADAAGLSILTGLVRPDEGLPVSEGGQGVINHAIRFTLQNSIILDQFIYPASHIANSGTNTAVMPPMGARFRLKAGVDISQLNPEARVIAQAMKDYGMIVADNGSNFFFSGASYAVDAANHQTLTWNDNDIQDSVHGLKSLTFSDFEVVDLTPQVTDLSVHSGAAGTSVTVSGHNFSGAAGRLQVLFGSTQATSVTVVDDAHVVAVAPAGSGTVDVRVQSGVTTGANSENIKTPIFGYGISSVVLSGRFTYGTTSNAAPTVTTAAKATPSPVTGTTTNLSVLGADDGGEANLRYTWSSTGPAAVSFSSNGANASKNTTATFTQPGSYTFTVTIADAQGASVTSSVNVTVSAPNTAPTVATAAAASPNPVTGTTTNLSVLGADEGGEANLRYTWSSTGPAAVSFSVNGTNASKNTTATFTQPGSYTFTVTIADAQSATVTSSVNVSVSLPNAAPTVATSANGTPNPVTGTTTTLSVLGADDGGEANLHYTWSSTGPAAVSFSANGTNAAKNTTATFTKAGVYTFTVTISDAQGASVTSSVNVTVSAPNAVPTVATAAKGTPNPVTGTTSMLSVLGADDGGEANLHYIWSSTGPAAVKFSANGTNAAKNTIATFTKAGVYTFTATITDAAGKSITSSVSVTVQQKLTSIAVTPGTATLQVRQQLQFKASAFDQFGALLTSQPAVTWTVTGGAITSTGLYTAPTRAGGPFTITASAAGFKGTAKVTVVMNARRR